MNVTYQGYSPKDLLYRGRKGLSWVFCLRGCQANELCSSERESGCDESTTQAFEAVVKRAGIVPL
jgi:hypothetical protein